MSEPITLPADYASVWASRVEEPKPLKTPSMLSKNPFSDKNKASTIAFSDYTESDMNIRKERQERETRKEHKGKEPEWLAKSYERITGTSVVDYEYEEMLQKCEETHAKILELQRNKRGNKKSGKEYSREMSDLLTQFNYLAVKTNMMSQGKDRETAERDLEELDQVQKRWEKETKELYVTLEDFKTFAKEVSKSLHPMDSASNLNVEVRHGHETLPEIPETDEGSSDLERTIVGGYTMNASEKLREMDAFSSVSRIRGLPVMFTNSRLNFLTHVHSALFRIISDQEGNYPSRDCLQLLLENRKTWGDEPSTLLLESVIDSTIDTRTGVVLANPFRIPILEPTMQLTEKIMYMALDQLHREFETEWFNTMKFITTPKFQSKYENLKFKSDRTRRRGNYERRPSSSSSSGRANSSRRSSSGGSVLSTLFG